ncbi:hypothetical protein PVAND_014559 [Polypedilum vanderplanki]|uniref:Metalloendopeptidase n=1 Tax=Polypedilum vanderplanki TaxID=319348 RepID=A0A9J6B9R6_POLVA|nr:hypothetical protein PVAND_014559 [Polypedilum vanderplanki]
MMDYHEDHEEEYEDFYDEEILEDSEEYNDEGGTAILNTKSYWPKVGNFVIIPYYVNLKSGISKERKRRIEAALRRIASRTCIRFKKAKGHEKNFIEFISPDKNTCSSPVGMNPNKPNQIKLYNKRSGCFKIGTILHETIHSLGFGHMHKHTSRDKYVKIYLENIKEPRQKSYYLHSADAYTNFDTKYDFFSIMHYGPGSKEAPKMRPKRKYLFYAKYMGQRNRMSDGDVERINKMYQCDKKYWSGAPDDYNDVSISENESSESYEEEETEEEESDEDE